MSFDRGSYRCGKTLLEDRSLRTRFRADSIPGSAGFPSAGTTASLRPTTGGTPALPGMPRPKFAANVDISVLR